MWERQYLGRFEGVVRCEGDVQEEDSALVNGARGAQDGRPPLIDVVSFGTSTVGAVRKIICIINEINSQLTQET